MKIAIAQLLTASMIGVTLFASPAASAAANDEGPQETASPAPEGEALPAEIAGVPLDEPSHQTVTVSEATLDNARAEAVEQQENGEPLNAEERAVEQELVDASEASGSGYDTEDLDVVQVLGGDVTVALPATIELDRLTLDITSDGQGNAGVEVSASTSESEDALTAGGPGMASWAQNGDGDYVLKVTGFGTALFTYARVKMINDGSAAYTWYAYKRKGLAMPRDISGGPDPRVVRMKIQNYPYSSTRSGLLNWNEWDPTRSWSNCNNGPYNASVSIFGEFFGLNFDVSNCEDYDVALNADVPSSYAMSFDQGAWIGAGDRSVGYSVAWKAKAGTAGSQNDYQSVLFRRSGDGEGCSSTNADKTCTP